MLAAEFESKEELQSTAREALIAAAAAEQATARRGVAISTDIITVIGQKQGGTWETLPISAKTLYSWLVPLGLLSVGAFWAVAHSKKLQR